MVHIDTQTNSGTISSDIYTKQSPPSHADLAPFATGSDSHHEKNVSAYLGRAVDLIVQSDRTKDSLQGGSVAFDYPFRSTTSVLYPFFVTVRRAGYPFGRYYRDPKTLSYPNVPHRIDCFGAGQDSTPSTA